MLVDVYGKKPQLNETVARIDEIRKFLGSMVLKMFCLPQ